jgi:Putative adhesin
MTRWTIDEPTTLDFDGVAALRVRIISGSVAVLSTDERPCLDIANLSGQPLLVSHEAGILTITYEDLTWEGLLGWLRPQRRSLRHSAAITITVPKDCPTQLGVVNASAIVSGISARTSVRSVSGNITLDGVTGSVEARTVSGDIEAQGIDGRIGFNSVSGDLTLADGTVHHLDAKTVSGRITADIDLEDDGGLRVGTVSGAVAIRLPAEVSTQVALRSTTGRLLSEFTGLHSSNGPGSNTLTGALGASDSTGRLSVTTMSGQVTLLQRNHSGPAGEHTNSEGETR